MWLTPAPEQILFIYVCIAVFGAVIGSFIGCALYRVPRGLSLRQPKHSYCPSCNTRLTALDLVPVLSWLLSRGRCRHCGTPMSTHYVLVETATILSGLLAYALLGPQLKALVIVPAAWALVYVSGLYVGHRLFAGWVLLFSCTACVAFLILP